MLISNWITNFSVTAEAINKGVRTCSISAHAEASHGTVRDYSSPLCTIGAAPARKQTPKVRRITSWMLRHPDNVTEYEQIGLKQVLANCPTVLVRSKGMSIGSRCSNGKCTDELVSTWSANEYSSVADTFTIDHGNWARTSS